PVVPALEVGDLRIAYYRVLVVIMAIAAIIALHLILQNTKIGKAMRAVADNIDLARVSGINVEQVVLWTWIITGILTAFAGSMYGLIAVVRPTMGWFLILPMFASVILGGIGNPYGAIVGALVIGVAQELSVPLLGSEYKLGIALAIMILILLVRPQGLFKS
ncbi:MAG: branched-chain amino acid ABC transporter permease, partial [Waterburya sp.]